MQLYRRNLHAEQSQVLHDECIDPGLHGLKDGLPRSLQFLLVDKRIESKEDFGPETAGVCRQLSDVGETVAGSLPGSECRSCDIYGIGTAVYSRDADVLIPGRSQKL